MFTPSPSPNSPGISDSRSGSEGEEDEESREEEGGQTSSGDRAYEAAVYVSPTNQVSRVSLAPFRLSLRCLG